jgi:hypothetical protein
MEPIKKQLQSLCKSRKSATETMAMIRQAFGEESRAVHGKSKLTENEKGETGEEQSQEHAYYFL